MPLDRALVGFSGWITGRKRYHGDLRATLPRIEAIDGRIKVNPLADWSAAAIRAAFAERGLTAAPPGGERVCLDRLRTLHAASHNRIGRPLRPLARLEQSRMRHSPVGPWLPVWGGYEQFIPDKCVAYRKDLPMESKDYSEIRAAVRKLCARFPGEYWRELDRDEATRPSSSRR